MAKLTEAREATEDAAAAPTVVKGNSPTIAGMIMGTAEYMSPEQASGKPVDKRTDIWAFGVVLHEMLTGQRMFSGETVSHTLADVLRAPIDFKRLPETTPKLIRDLLRRCLNRDWKQRLRDIGEARLTIDAYLANPEPGEESSVVPRAEARRPWIWISPAGGLAAIAAAASFGWWSATRYVETPLVQLDLDLGPDVSLGTTLGSELALSPDGSRTNRRTRSYVVRKAPQARSFRRMGSGLRSSPPAR